MLTKTLIVLSLFLIVASLGAALFYLLKDRNRSPRTVKALTARIGMSLALFFLLLVGYQAGVLRPHGLRDYRPQPVTVDPVPSARSGNSAEAARAAH